MSTLKVDTIQNSSGGNASTTDNIQQGIAKAWVNFDGGGTLTSSDQSGVRDSFNVSSVIDNGTGDYTVTFATAMSNANYAVALSHKEDETDATGSGARPMMRRGAASFYSTTAVRVINSNMTSGAGSDSIIFNVIIFGD
tara:strand:+ start:73 stop:489 length:417 start_codon:yes stop_codon:yes gene_type:complete